MKNKLFNTIQIILVPIFLLSLFIPMFSNDYYYYGYYDTSIKENFYSKAPYDSADYGMIWMALILISCFIMLYMCKAAMYMNKEKALPKFFSLSKKLVIKGKFPITYFMPAICILSLAIYCIIIDGGKVHINNWEYYYENVNPLCLIPLTIIVVMIAVSVFDFFKTQKKSAFEENSAENNVSNTVFTVGRQTEDTADDLIKLKELLDMGIITQEEFDAKKKQILDL